MQQRSAQPMCGRVGPVMGLAILAAAGLALSACERPDPSAEAIQKAEGTLTVLGSSGSVALPSKSPDIKLVPEALNRALSEVQPASQGGKESAAIASAISGTVNEGQGGLLAAKYREADASLLVALNQAKARARLYADRVALSKAVLAYEPMQSVPAWDARRKELEAELSRARAALEENESKTKALMDQAAAKTSEGRSLREMEAALSTRLLDAPMSERPALATQVNEARRAWQLVLKDAELLEAQAARVAPQSVELRLDVTRVEMQLASIGKAKEEAVKASEQGRARSREQQDAAAATATELVADVKEVQRLLAEVVKPAFDEAAGKLAASMQKWGQASGGPAAGPLQTGTGSAAISDASLRREYAEAIGRVIWILEYASKIEPAIPSADEFASAAQTLTQERDAVVQDALQSYERATGSFERGGASGDAAERGQVLVERLKKMTALLSGKPMEPAEGETATPTDGSDEMQPAEAPADSMQPAPGESGMVMPQSEPEPAPAEEPAPDAPADEPAPQ